MIIEHFEQGTDAWHQARLGIPTASEFSRIITPSGDPSKQQQGYAEELAAERLTGEYKEFSSRWTEQGHEREPQAVSEYEFTTFARTEQVGIVYRDHQREVACSPDSLVIDPDGNPIGGLECKAPSAWNHVHYLLEETVPSQYVPQVQGSLWVTGLPWWDFVSYHPKMRPLIVRAYPDPVFHLTLDRAMPAFLARVKSIVQQVKGEDQ